MKLHNPELVGALLDGELKGLQRLLVQHHVSRCAICAAEHRHQRHVRALLAANPPAGPMSDSAEFFWSKVRRGIEAQSNQRMEVPVPRLSLWDWLDHRRYALAGVTACAVAAMAVLWIAQVYRTAPTPAVVATHILVPRVTVEHMGTVIPNTVASAVDANDDVAVIWVSGLPWTANMTEMKTVFANLDS